VRIAIEEEQREVIDICIAKKSAKVVDHMQGVIRVRIVRPGDLCTHTYVE
jgi:hypothetical protein